MAKELELIFYDKAEMTFHNSVPLPESQMAKAREDAKKQKAIILSIFKQYPELKFTAYEMWCMLNEMGVKALQTSVRRAITDLTTANRLYKCMWSDGRPGEFGTWTRTWKFNENYMPPLNSKK